MVWSTFPFPPSPQTPTRCWDWPGWTSAVQYAHVTGNASLDTLLLAACHKMPLISLAKDRSSHSVLLLPKLGATYSLSGKDYYIYILKLFKKTGGCQWRPWASWVLLSPGLLITYHTPWFSGWGVTKVHPLIKVIKSEPVHAPPPHHEIL